MALQQLEDLFEQFEKVTLHHIVYEAGDESMLLSCEVTAQNKTFHTHVPINFSGLNNIIGRFLQKGIDLYEVLSEKLFNTQDRFREFHLKNLYGDAATFYNLSLLQAA